MASIDDIASDSECNYYPTTPRRDGESSDLFESDGTCCLDVCNDFASDAETVQRISSQMSDRDNAQLDGTCCLDDPSVCNDFTPPEADSQHDEHDDELPFCELHGVQECARIHRTCCLYDPIVCHDFRAPEADAQHDDHDDEWPFCALHGVQECARIDGTCCLHDPIVCHGFTLPDFPVPPVLLHSVIKALATLGKVQLINVSDHTDHNDESTDVSSEVQSSEPSISQPLGSGDTDSSCSESSKGEDEPPRIVPRRGDM